MQQVEIAVRAFEAFAEQRGAGALDPGRLSQSDLYFLADLPVKIRLGEFDEDRLTAAQLRTLCSISERTTGRAGKH
jgi:hypothetical protein